MIGPASGGGWKRTRRPVFARAEWQMACSGECTPLLSQTGSDPRKYGTDDDPLREAITRARLSADASAPLLRATPRHLAGGAQRRRASDCGGGELAAGASRRA